MNQTVAHTASTLQLSRLANLQAVVARLESDIAEQRAAQNKATAQTYIAKATGIDPSSFAALLNGDRPVSDEQAALIESQMFLPDGALSADPQFDETLIDARFDSFIKLAGGKFRQADTKKQQLLIDLVQAI
jgi:hypothetical protein